jgi:hypothetical protein
MKTRDIKRFIERAEKKYEELNNVCSVLAQEAQRYIPWGTVSCQMFPGDGLCFVAEPSGVASVVPVTIFFSLAKNQDAPTITEVQFLNMSI